MAVSMRAVNVRKKCACASFRYFLLKDRNVFNSSFSHISKLNSNTLQHEEEDFFGIPENFKLQQVRLGTTDGKRSPVGQSEDVARVPEEPSHSDIHTRSRRERRAATQTSFHTSFGAITLDRAVINQLPDANSEKVAMKAREILTKLNIEKRNIPSSGSNKTTIEISKDCARDMNLKQMKTNAKNLKQTGQNFATVGHRTRTSYFDEVYFPEQVVEDNTSKLKPASGHVSNRHVPRGSSAASHSHNSVSHLPVSEASSDGARNIDKHMYIHDAQQEHQKPDSLNFVDDQYFGDLRQSFTAVECVQSCTTESAQPAPDNINKTSTVVKRKKTYDGDNKRIRSSEAVDYNEVDLQYFGNLSENRSDNPQETVSVDTRVNSPFLSVDESYIDPVSLQENYKPSWVNEKGNMAELVQQTEEEPLQINEKDNLKKVRRSKTAVQKTQTAMEKSSVIAAGKQQIHNTFNRDLNIVSVPDPPSHVKDKKANNPNDQQESNEPTQQEQLTKDIILETNEQFLKMRKTSRVRTEPNADQTETAYDVAMKYRRQFQGGVQTESPSSQQEDNLPQALGETLITGTNIKLDSKGFRVLDNQVPDLNKMTSADIVRMLKKRIIFNHEDFLAIDKPYGLPCYSQAQDRVSVTDLLPALAELLPRSFHTTDLHLVQGLDRDVTGAIILAKNPEVAHIIRGMYKDSDLVTQRFWVITKGVPHPPAGIVDIPIGEAKVGNIYKMVLRPRFLKDEKWIGHSSRAASDRAITQYKIVGSYFQSALVECVPLTNVKHQIRLHLASGLSTPILGDHKYSSFAKLTPQKLHVDMLALLKIRQASVRHLPLHLHCRSIILKDYKGRMIFLTTYPPPFFRDNLSSLKIPKPRL